MTLNEQAILKMLNDSSFYDELTAYLNVLIDAELEKPDSQMDCNLIEECTNILLSAESGDKTNAAILIPFVSSERLIDMAKSKTGFASLSKGARAAIIAASVAALTLGSNAAVAATTGINVLSNLGTAVYETLEDWGIIKNDPPQETAYLSNVTNEGEIGEAAPEETAEKTAAEEIAPQPAAATVKSSTEEGEAGNPEESAPVALRLSFADDFKTQYYWGESLNLNGLTVTAVYNENKTKTVPVKDCTVSGYNKALEGTQKILVEYRGAKASFEITLTKTTAREERFVTGVEGTPPTKQVYTTEDTTLSLAGLSVRLIYSDGTYSNYRTHSDAVIKTYPDFTKLGEQEITLRISNKADFTYTIIVTAPEEETPEIGITDISLDFNNYTFALDEKLDDNFNIRVNYEDETSELLTYGEHKDEFEIINLNTSTLLYTPRTFTVVYKEHSATAQYTVVASKLTVKSATITVPGAIFSSQGPKFLYYKGEPFGYDEGSRFESILNELVSTNQFDGNNQITKGSNFSVKVSYLEKWSTNAVSIGCYDLEYAGYDPYKEGYQTIDIYTKDGIYLTSYTIFVYGDEGYAPLSRLPYEIEYGKESKSMPRIQGWAKCMGDGELSNAYGNTMNATHRFVKEPGDLGRVKCYAELTDGTQYPYALPLVKKITECEFIGENNLLYIKLEELGNYDFGNRKFKITYSDNSSEEIYLNDMISGCYYQTSPTGTSTEILTSKSPIGSVFADISFSLDHRLYSGCELINNPIKAYVYSNGYENAIQFICEDDDISKGAYYKTSFTEWQFLWNTEFYLVAYNNKIMIPYAYNNVTIEGVEWGTVGDYTATIKTTYNGMEFSCTQDIHIVD